MIATWMAGKGTASATIAAVTTMIERATSGASVRHMTSTAWATTATAASLSPRTQPASVRSADSVSSANATRMIADGRVNPSQPTMPPSRPARSVPIAIPSWLLAGPGSAWLSASRSAKRASSSHRRRSTYSRRK